MATAKALGDGPIVFVDSDGLQKSIPLASVQFDGTSIVTVPATTPGSPLDRWLKYLASTGRLRPETTASPPGVPAIIFTAAAVGSQGNNIDISAAPNATDATKIDLTVTARDHYTGLTTATLVATLGSAAAAAPAGSLPGLLRVSGTVAAGSVPVAGDLTAAGGLLHADDMNHPGTDAFALAPRSAGSDATGATLTATVSNVQTNGAFDLDVTWTIPVRGIATGDMVQATLVTKLAPFGFALAFSAPISGGVSQYKLPAPGTARLSGGQDPAKASSALLSA